MIEAAVRLDGSVPVHEFLQTISQSQLAAVLVRFEDLARFGTLTVPEQLNDLHHGLWEIKAETVRLPFYYAQHPGTQAVRLTSGFHKNQRFTQNRHIRYARMIWSEDLQS
jgi:hypothetical protein